MNQPSQHIMVDIYGHSQEMIDEAKKIPIVEFIADALNIHMSQVQIISPLVDMSRDLEPGTVGITILYRFELTDEQKQEITRRLKLRPIIGPVDYSYLPTY